MENDDLKNNSKVYLIKKFGSIAGQVAFILSFPVIFNLAAVLGSGNDASFSEAISKPMVAGTAVAFFVLFFISVVLALIAFHSDNEKQEKKTPSIAKDYVIIAVVSLLVRLPMIGTFQRWDAGEFFYTVGSAVKNYDFTLAGFFETFSVREELNHGFTGFIAIPLFFAPRSVLIITLWQIAVTVLAIMALYNIFKICFDFSRLKSIVSALLIGSVPIFLGTSAYCTPEYYLTLFFIFALYFEAKEKYILEAFAFIMMCFTTSDAIMLVIGYFAVKTFVSFMKGYNPKRTDKRISREEYLAEFETRNDKKPKAPKPKISKRIKAVFTSVDTWVALLIAGMYIVAMVFKDDIESETLKTFVINSDNMELRRGFIILKLKQYFMSNFAWVIVAILMLAFNSILMNRLWKKFYPTGRRVMVGIMGAIGVYGIYEMLYPDVGLPRINIVFAVMLLVIMCIFVEVAIDGSASYVLLTIVLGILLGIEGYVTIDPATKGVFAQVPIGNEKTMNFEGEKFYYFGDGFVTNYQFAWLDKAFDKMLEKIDYSDETPIYLASSEYSPASGTHFGGNDNYYRIGWFEDRKKRGYYDEDMTGWSEMNLRCVGTDSTWFPYIYLPHTNSLMNDELANRAYACFVPYFSAVGVDDNSYISELRESYYVGQKKQVTAYRGTLDYYPMVKKDNYIEDISLDLVVNELREYGEPYEELSDEQMAVATAENAEVATDGDAAIDETIWNSGVENASLQAKIDRLYTYKLSQYLEIDTVQNLESPDKRIGIQPMDAVLLEYELYGPKGERINLRHDGDELIVKVGVGELIDEVDQELMRMVAGEVREIEIEVVDDYPELSTYRGQKVTVRLMPMAVLGTYKYNISEEEKAELLKEVEDMVMFDYNLDVRREKVRSYIRENYPEGIGSALNAEIDDERMKKIDIYMEDYLREIDVNKEKYIKDILGATTEEYEAAIRILASYEE